MQKIRRLTVNAKKVILTVCGTGGVTSSVTSTKVRELLEKNKISAEVHSCKVIEVDSFIDSLHPDLIITSSPLPHKNVPVILGLSFLTGIGVDETEKEILSKLREEEKNG
jgi:PTS system galactitol-specific IIB component